MLAIAEYEDGDEYGDEEDYAEEETVRKRSGPKKKKRKKSNALLDLEAEEDDADDEEEEDEVGDLIAEDDDDAEVNRDREHMRVQRLERARAMEDEDPDAMERYFRDKFGSEDYADEEEETGAPDTSGIDQQSLLPTIHDPRLFIVRCRKPGHERRAVLSLLQKMFNLRRKGLDIGIFSAIAPDHLKGRVYIEAISAQQVQFAISGMDLFTTYDGIKPLRLDEMTDVLKVGKRPDKQVEGNWVRMSRGVYKGDLAQVCGVREGTNEGQLMIRMIPRLDFKGEKDYMEDLETEEYDDERDKNGPRRKGRPPQRLFDKKELFRLTGSADVYSQRDRQTGAVYEVWNDDLFRFGLLHKRVSVKTLVTGDAVKPLVEELDQWLLAEKNMRAAIEEDPTSMDAEEAQRGLGLDISSVAGRRGTKLFKGDSVRVVAGEQKGLAGIIDSIEGDVVNLQTPEFPEPLSVNKADVRKVFRVGEHIKVASGPKAGYAGFIARVDGDVITVFTDSTREEIRVLSAQLADSSDINSDIGSQKAGLLQSRRQYELFDLVQMLADPTEKGIVIQVRDDGVRLLNARNEAIVVPVGAIKGKVRDTHIRVLDSKGNPIASNDTIYVSTGAQRERQGVVKHVTGSTVFFRARDELNNCGIVAVPAADCTASSAAARKLTTTFRGMHDSKMQAPLPRGSMSTFGRGGFGGGRGRGGGRPPGRDSLLRADVKVKKGPYKGYAGKVVDVTEAKVRVELTSKMKTITLPREWVRDLNAAPQSQPANGTSSHRPQQATNSQSNSDSYGKRNPSYTQTPRNDNTFQNRTPHVDRFGSHTPRHGSATPRGNATPSHFGTTPGRDDFGRTPGREGYGGFGDARTPLPNTPANEPVNPYTPFAAATPATPSGGIPATPLGAAYPAVEPRTPAAIVEPNTPAYAGVEPQTPAPGVEPATPAPGLEPRTPAPGLEPRTPAPGVEPSTPLMHDPTTPHTPGLMPQTPRPPEEEAAELGYRVLIGVEVLVIAENNFPAVVVSANADGTDIVVRMLGGENKGKEIQAADVTPVQPRSDIGEKQELVKVLDGEYVGRVGRLLSVFQGNDDEWEGQIRFTTGEDAKLQMSLVAKCYEG